MVPNIDDLRQQIQAIKKKVPESAPNTNRERASSDSKGGGSRPTLMDRRLRLAEEEAFSLPSWSNEVYPYPKRLQVSDSPCSR